MSAQHLIDWLLEGDVAIQYQTYRDLLGEEKPELQSRIAEKGWGAAFLAKQKPEGGWGQSFYQPKWVSSHYTILDLRNLAFPPNHPILQQEIIWIAENHKSEDGGVNPHRELKWSDICVNGMFLNYASYFNIPVTHLESVVDFLLDNTMEDGGFNCRLNRSGARHSSMHSTLSVMEGIRAYLNNGYTYRAAELQQAEQNCQEFLLMHQLYLSDRTGAIIHKDFLRMPYPRRWKYDILSALDYFQLAEYPWDNRMLAAMEVLYKKRNKQGSWNTQAKHPGQLHFEMEKAGRAGRWNTLRALRVLRQYESSFLRTEVEKQH
jgi:hypothetical protein